MGPQLRQALASAPLDYVDLWGSAVLRYAVNGLVGAGAWEALRALWDLILEPLPPGQLPMVPGRRGDSLEGGCRAPALGGRCGRCGISFCNPLPPCHTWIFCGFWSTSRRKGGGGGRGARGCSSPAQS